MLVQLRVYIAPSSSSTDTRDLGFWVVLRGIQMGQVDDNAIGDTVLVVRPVSAATDGYVPVASTVAGRVQSEKGLGELGSSAWDYEAPRSSLRIFGPRAFD